MPLAAPAKKPTVKATTHPDHQTLINLLDRTPLRLPHFIAWYLSSGGTLLDGFSVFMLSISLPFLIRQNGYTAWVIGLLGASLVAGAILGASLGGRLADRIGRKSVFLLDMALLALFGLLGAFSWDPWWLIGSQFLVGTSIGMDFPVSSSYMAECMPHKHRSQMMVATIMNQAVGLLLAAAIGLGILYFLPSREGWRLFIGAEALIAVFFLLARLYLPESPRWLMGQGRNLEAIRALERLIPHDRQELDRMAKRLGSTVHWAVKSGIQKNIQPSLGILFTPAYRRRTLLVSIPWLLMDVATYGIGLFTAVLLSALHFDNGRTLIAHVAALTKGSGLVDAFLLFGFLAGIWAVGRFGRIRMQIIGFIGMAIGMIILLLSSLLNGGASSHIALVLMGFIIFNLLMNMGPNSTTFILPAELFPTQVRATAAGFAAAIAKLGATLGVFCLPIIKDSLGVPAVLALMTILSLLGTVSTYWFRIQQQDRTLEELHRDDLP